MAITRLSDSALSSTRLPPFRNIIINGDMSIAQRGTSQASAGAPAGAYDTVDRFGFAEQLGTFSMSQSTDVPTGQGFAKSVKLECTTADASPAINAYLQLYQRIEGQNLQYLKKGTSSAESLTLSFWVKSNKTGTYIAELDDNDNARNINKSYTINSADTWEKKTLTYAGDTTGVLDNDNGDSLRLIFWLGAGTDFSSGTLATSWESTNNPDRAVGQVNLADTVSNYINITGVQLEAGTDATDFEYLPADVNLQRCERYYQVLADGTEQSQAGLCSAGQYSTSAAYGVLKLSTIMRAAPTMEQVTGTDFYRFRSGGGNYNGTLTLAISTPRSFRLQLSRAEADIPANAGGWIGLAGSSAAKVAVSAEL